MTLSCSLPLHQDSHWRLQDSAPHYSVHWTIPNHTQSSLTAMEGVAFTPSAASQQQAYILCADCGTPIPPNSANRCVNCLRNSVDITEGIPKQAAISFCRNCDRWLSPPQAWLIAELESRELLAICLRKMKGLKEVRLVDAGFIWTEPHSKRLRVKLTVQKEVRTAVARFSSRDCITDLPSSRSSHLPSYNRYSRLNTSFNTPNAQTVLA